MAKFRDDSADFQKLQQLRAVQPPGWELHCCVNSYRPFSAARGAFFANPYRDRIQSMRKLTSTSCCLWHFLPLAFVPSAVAGPIFNFSGTQGPCSGQPPTAVGSGGSTIQVTGLLGCGSGLVPPPSGSPLGTSMVRYDANTVIVSGTGSGIFDSNFLPAGFTASGVLTGPLSGSLSINGLNVGSGLGNATWNVGPALLNMTLSTWQFIISGGPVFVTIPPGGQPNPFLRKLRPLSG